MLHEMVNPFLVYTSKATQAGDGPSTPFSVLNLHLPLG